MEPNDRAPTPAGARRRKVSPLVVLLAAALALALVWPIARRAFDLGRAQTTAPATPARP